MNLSEQKGTLVVGLMGADEVEKYWPLFAETLDRYPQLWEVTTKDQLEAQIKAGKMQMWGACDLGIIEVVMVTQIVAMSSGDVEFQCELLVGRNFMKYWKLIVKTFEESATMIGCTKLVVHTRRDGLAGLLERQGYELRLMELVKTLPKVPSRKVN